MGEQNKTGAGGPRPGFRDACAVGFKLLGLRSCSVIRRGGWEWGHNLILFCRLKSRLRMRATSGRDLVFFFFRSMCVNVMILLWVQRLLGACGCDEHQASSGHKSLADCEPCQRRGQVWRWLLSPPHGGLATIKALRQVGYTPLTAFIDSYYFFDHSSSWRLHLPYYVASDRSIEDIDQRVIAINDKTFQRLQGPKKFLVKTSSHLILSFHHFVPNEKKKKKDTQAPLDFPYSDIQDSVCLTTCSNKVQRQVLWYKNSVEEPEEADARGATWWDAYISSRNNLWRLFRMARNRRPWSSIEYRCPLPYLVVEDSLHHTPRFYFNLLKKAQRIHVGPINTLSRLQQVISSIPPWLDIDSPDGAHWRHGAAADDAYPRCISFEYEINESLDQVYNVITTNCLLEFSPTKWIVVIPCHLLCGKSRETPDEETLKKLVHFTKLVSRFLAQNQFEHEVTRRGLIVAGGPGQTWSLCSNISFLLDFRHLTCDIKPHVVRVISWLTGLSQFLNINLLEPEKSVNEDTTFCFEQHWARVRVLEVSWDYAWWKRGSADEEPMGHLNGAKVQWLNSPFDISGEWNKIEPVDE